MSITVGPAELAKVRSYAQVHGRRLGLDPDDAESAANEALARALTTYRPCGERTDPWAYILQRVKWALVDEVRHLYGDNRHVHRLRPVPLDGALTSHEPVEPTDVEDEALSRIVCDELARRVETAIAGFIERDQNIIRAVVLEGRPGRAVAAEHGLHEARVSQIRREFEAIARHQQTAA